MEKINRGRLTISANILLTASLITRTFTFGFIMMLILMKANNDILNEDVIKIVDIEELAGMPVGTTVKSIVFSFIGVFFLELVTGIFGIWGVIGRKKRVLAINVLMSSIMIVVYFIYIVLLSIIYVKKADLKETLKTYTSVYQNYIRDTSNAYQDQENTFETFLKKLGCNSTDPIKYDCESLYVQKLDTYLEIYIGVIVTCIVCQVVTIVAAEYTFRKLEFKEKKSSISKNTYYLLLTVKLGIFRSMIFFIKDNWNRSKVVVASVILKISSLAAGVGLLVLGLTLLGDVFISDGSLRHIFYKLQFHNYYFYDILAGLAAASVVIGLLTSSLAVLGLVGSWKKSPTILGTSSVFSLVLHIPRFIAVILWIVFIEKINDGMKFQLRLQQAGYFYGSNGNEITGKWNDMILTLQCCGVDYPNDTLTSVGTQFCCRNAHRSIMDSDYSNYTPDYSAVLEHLFGGCGDYKTETCADAILFRTRMYVSWFLAIVLLQIVLEVIGVIFVNKEYSVILLTNRTGKSTGEALHAKSVIFRKLFRGIQSFCTSNWKRSKMTIVHLISLGILFVCNLVVICLAISIRYDKVFGNSEIKKLFSRITIAYIYNFTKTINVFSVVNVTLSSVSIAVVIFSIVLLILPKWNRVLSFVSIGLWCIVAVSNFIQVGLFMRFFNNVSSGLEDRLMNQFNTSYMNDGGYDYSDNSATHESSSSLSWNTLFVQAECCGVGPTIESSFKSTYWYKQGDGGEKIPVQCCISQSNVFPYSTIKDSNCTSSMVSDGYFHSRSCDDAVNKLLKVYSFIFIFVMVIIILAEICCVVTTMLNAKRFKQEATLLNRSMKASRDDTEIRKDDKTQKEKDNAKKERKHGDTHAKGSTRNKRSRSKATVDLHQREKTIVPENTGENIELHTMKSMEIEDKVNEKRDKPTNKRRQEEDEFAEKDLTMPDN